MEVVVGTEVADAIIADAIIVNISCDGSVIFDIRQGNADGEAVGHGRVNGNHAYDTSVVIDVYEVTSHGEGCGADTAADGAQDTGAHYAAVRVCIFGYGMDGDITADAAVLHDAATTIFLCNIPHDATDKTLTDDAGISQDDVLNDGSTSQAEEALVAVIIGITTLVDADAADGMTLAVEDAIEGFINIIDTTADGGIVVLGICALLIVGFVAVGDVGTQTEVLVVEDFVVAVVHQRGQ